MEWTAGLKFLEIMKPSRTDAHDLCTRLRNVLDFRN